MFIAIQGGCWVYFALHHGLLPPSEYIPLHTCLPPHDYITFQPIVADPGCSPCWSLRYLPQTIHTKKTCFWVVLHRHIRQPKGPLQDVSTASVPQANVTLVRSPGSGHGHLNPLSQTKTLSSRRSSIKVHRSIVKSGEKLGMFIAIQGGCWVYFALHHGLLPPSECISLHKCLPLHDYITFQPIVAHPGFSPCWSHCCLPQTIHTKKACFWVVLHRHSRQPKGSLQDVSTASVPQVNHVGEVSGIGAWKIEPALPNQNIVQPPQLH